MLAPPCNLEAEALLEHGFRCKKCAVPSSAGLAVRRFRGKESAWHVVRMWLQNSGG